MDHPMTSIINATEEIAAASAFGPTVRLLKVAHTASLDPSRELVELPALETRWTPASNVSVANFSATCFLTGSMLQRQRGYPVGLIDSSWAGVGITTLSSAASCARCGIDANIGCPGSARYFPINASSVYNTMIAPLHRMTVFGVLWWQGENSGAGCPQQRTNATTATYYCLWQALISDWRARWHERSTTAAELPFGFVQLEPTANPAIRWDETAHRVSVPNPCLPGVFMAAALDFGDTVAGVHTRYKRPIAARLARSAAAVAYQESGVYFTGPVASTATASPDGTSVVVTFANPGAGGIDLRGPGGFSVCPVAKAALCWEWANDGLFHNATATIGAAPNEVVLSVPAGAGPVGLVRYEWNALPCRWPALESCAVYSKEGGLPAPPFMIGVGATPGLQPPPCLGPPAPAARAVVLPSAGEPPQPPQPHPSHPPRPPHPPRDALSGPHRTPSDRSGRKFVHPGVLVGPKQLKFVREQVGVANSTFNLTLAKLQKYTWLNARNKTGMSPDWNGTVACGYFDSHDYGCRNESTDATVVWIQAMLWAATGEEKWAIDAVRILNFYGKHLKAYGLGGNGPLEAAWAADKWARAAELLSATGAPWEPADVDAFRHMLTTVSVPMLYNGSCFNGNWELAMIEGMSSIAVFTENAALWDHSIAMWRSRLPAYFYMAADGPAPVALARCDNRSYWYNQVVFNGSVDGVSQETCRDFGHLSYGLASTFNVAETALVQGVDLYTPNAERLRAALEFHTAFLNQGGYPPSGSPYKPSARNVSNAMVCNGTQLKLSYAPTYQVGLTGMTRLLGSADTLPQTSAYVRDWVWGLSAGDACPPFMYCEEALTHAAPAPKA